MKIPKEVEINCEEYAVSSLMSLAVEDHRVQCAMERARHMSTSIKNRFGLALSLIACS